MTQGTRGYAEAAHALIARYESVGFEEKHAPLLHLVPRRPSEILDIGAGTGGDAAWLAKAGHRVCAVEPTAELREYGMAHHASPGIEWIDDRLPGLPRVVSLGRAFDAAFATAVWMHLDAAERAHGIRVVHGLLRPGGTFFMSLRHGPVPEGRMMFEVPAAEMVSIALAAGFAVLAEVPAPSVQAANRERGVTWTQLAFSRVNSYT